MQTEFYTKLFLVYYTMMRFHNNQVWRSEESHFQLLKLNLALKLDSYTYPKNSSLHISHKHSLK